jgi:hypothetical protein
VFAQQLAILLLKRPRAMVLFLRLEVSQHHIKLARAYRKRAVAALPEKAAIPRVELFDSLEDTFLICSMNSAWEVVRGNVVTT